MARTVEEAGFRPVMSEAIAEKQAWAAGLGRKLAPGALAADELAPLLDALLALEPRGPKAPSVAQQSQRTKSNQPILPSLASVRRKSRRCKRRWCWCRTSILPGPGTTYSNSSRW